jgi:phosphoribosylamine--glycine ligase
VTGVQTCALPISVEFDERVAGTVMLVSGGYPGTYKKGIPMSGFESCQNSILFHAGTKRTGNSILTDGGRVLAISSYGPTMKDALAVSYSNAQKINFEGKYYRKDIGFDL